ncbi:uncharacterized protein LOC135401454 [Ornithodoros turicata]|uniref:uncharacterized protein LOC135401454 n=1 Tax=Ornithodoros turicata TaxID=34597 RepID=UPI003138F621
MVAPSLPQPRNNKEEDAAHWISAQHLSTECLLPFTHVDGRYASKLELIQATVRSNMAGAAQYFCILLALLYVYQAAGTHSSTHVEHPRLQPVVPCRLIPLSGWRPNKDIIHVLGSTRLLSFNGSSGIWKDSHLPNAHKLTASWRVVCANKHHVVISNGTHVSIFHLKSFMWSQIHDATDATDHHIAWCGEDEVTVVCLASGVRSKIDSNGNVTVTNGSAFPVAAAKKSYVLSWAVRDFTYVLVDKFWNGSRVQNATGLWKMPAAGSPGNWKLVSLWPAGKAGHPASLSKSYTWSNDTALWLWRELPTESQLWSFNVVTQSWTRHGSNHSSSLGSPLLAWNHGQTPCLLFANPTCTSNYSLSYLHCLKSVTKKKANSTLTTPKPNSTTVAYSTSPTTAHSTVTSRPTHAPLNTTALPTGATGTSFPTTQVVSRSNQSTTPLPPTTSTFNPRLPTAIGITELKDDQIEPSPMDSSQTKWHQQNSGIFGSIIFFGTSITIFTIVGAVWCIRHCVHFPKDALLLRDPPSVRYTAIPDTIA